MLRQPSTYFSISSLSELQYWDTDLQLPQMLLHGHRECGQAMSRACGGCLCFPHSAQLSHPILTGPLCALQPKQQPKHHKKQQISPAVYPDDQPPPCLTCLPRTPQRPQNAPAYLRIHICTVPFPELTIICYQSQVVPLWSTKVCGPLWLSRGGFHQDSPRRATTKHGGAALTPAQGILLLLRQGLCLLQVFLKLFACLLTSSSTLIMLSK